MRRHPSRPKYLAPAGNSAVSGHGTTAEEERLEAMSRLRRIADMPKRLSPLESASNVRFAFRSSWPDIEIQHKDVEAHKWWCLGIEDKLSHAFLDAQCPYRFLDPRRSGPQLEQVQSLLETPWGFREFLRDCDFPNDEQFDEWCDAMQVRLRTRQQQEG
mmetsp:Transcript_129723/g.228546  ORF Transcript_129723/g.228546 Transcript_129723/m.228546 type:complete len:159 (+) Transcript_129723:16-492(+)